MPFLFPVLEQSYGCSFFAFLEETLRNWDSCLFQIHSYQKGTDPDQKQLSLIFFRLYSLKFGIWRFIDVQLIEGDKVTVAPVFIKWKKKFFMEEPKMSVFPISNTQLPEGNGLRPKAIVLEKIFSTFFSEIRNLEIQGCIAGGRTRQSEFLHLSVTQLLEKTEKHDSGCP